jgi:hypothetical protein
MSIHNEKSCYFSGPATDFLNRRVFICEILRYEIIRKDSINDWYAQVTLQFFLPNSVLMDVSKHIT